MLNTDDLSREIDRVRVELLDPVNGRSLSCWNFENRETITIGRSSDQDVEVSDPYVSRHHASLLKRDGLWQLVSFGRHGVIVANQLVTECAAGIELRFRLGAQGPTLLFAVQSDTAVFDATYHVSDTAQQESGSWFDLDEKQIEREVTEVLESDYFQKLQKLADEMRKRRGNA